MKTVTAALALLAADLMATAGVAAPAPSAPKPMSPGHYWARNSAEVHERCKAIIGRGMDRRAHTFDSPAMQRRHQACIERALRRALGPPAGAAGSRP